MDLKYGHAEYIINMCFIRNSQDDSNILKIKCCHLPYVFVPVHFIVHTYIEQVGPILLWEFSIFIFSHIFV